MELSKVATDTATEMREVVKYILSLDIAPDDKAMRIAKCFRIVGSEFYLQMFGVSSDIFDSRAISTLAEMDNDQILRLSEKLIQNDVLGREVDYLVKDYYDSLLGKAENEAFKNAVSLGKHPTLKRIVVGETCNWCWAHAGTFVNPDGEDFARHRDCDCMFIVSGYNTRNGILSNYVKKGGK